MKDTLENNTFSIYRSSAGSGKTHQLAVEFISLAIGNPNLFNKILAVTFTNKATKEMKERILAFLVLLAEKKDVALLSQLKENTKLSEEAIAENARIVIGKILHQYAQFSVSTIDAFFQKIVKSFAKELGLLGNYKVEIDQDKIKQELIDQIIDELGSDLELTNWLVEFSFSKVDENKSWNIRPQIESLANEVFKESFRAIEFELEHVTRNDFKIFLEQVRTIKHLFENTIKSKARKALALMDAHGLSVDDFAYKGSGPAGYFDRIIIRNDFDPKTRVNEVIVNPEKWYSKTSPKKSEIQQVTEAGLQELTISIVDYYQKTIQDYTTATEVLRNFYVFGILTQIIQKLKNYRHENDVMLISDVPVFLKGIIAENDAPFIYEKSGSWYQHYLIDEFQDTSGFQWLNFKPLVENGLAQGYKSLLVGDGKQSIYRWRGGDWKLILHQVKEDLRSWKPLEKNLDTNWRSARKIVEFNNEVFGYLPSLLSNGFKTTIAELTLPEEQKEQLHSMASDVEGLYKDVAQRVASKNESPAKGVVEINAYQKDTENTSQTDRQAWKTNVLSSLPWMVEQLQDKGFQARDIAILVRKSDEGKQVIEQLIKHKKSMDAKAGYCYDAISNESLFLGNASVIRLLINTIKYAINPEDKIAFGEICYNFQSLQSDGKAPIENQDLAFILHGNTLPKGFLAEISMLIRRPVYEMVERIIQLFNLGGSQNKGYLQAFQDVVLEYFSNESKDINDFLMWWDEKGKRKSIQMPDSLNAIRVMTIHKSKGLEFKAVLLPFCDWNLDHDASKDNILWCKTDKKPFNNISVLPLKYNKKLAESHFAMDYFEEMIKAHIDNLNLLYVALTRAEDYLMVNCPPPSSGIKNAGDLLITALEKMLHATNGEKNNIILDESETLNTYTIGHFEGPVLAIKSVNQHRSSTNYQSADWRQKIAVRKKGALFFDSESSEKGEKINYGLLLHEILATIQTEKEADLLVEKYYVTGQLSSADRTTLRDQLHWLFSNPQIQSWFNTDWIVKTEAPIIVHSGELKRPDRVLIHGKNAIIVDFKTGLEKSTDKRQVLEYKKLLAEMGYQNIEAFLLYITLNKVIKIAWYEIFRRDRRSDSAKAC